MQVSKPDDVTCHPAKTAAKSRGHIPFTSAQVPRMFVKQFIFQFIWMTRFL